MSCCASSTKSACLSRLSFSMVWMGSPIASFAITCSCILVLASIAFSKVSIWMLAASLIAFSVLAAVSPTADSLAATAACRFCASAFSCADCASISRIDASFFTSSRIAGKSCCLICSRRSSLNSSRSSSVGSIVPFRTPRRRSLVDSSFAPGTSKFLAIRSGVSSANAGFSTASLVN